MQTQTELPLRDIQLPDPIGWWPPAPGWWLIAALTLVLITALWCYRRHSLAHRRRRRLLSALLAELNRLRQDIDQQSHRHTLQQLSILLRRASLSFFPRQDVASLTGQAWLDFVSSRSGIRFDESSSRLLTTDLYRSGDDIDRDSISDIIDILEAGLPSLSLGARS